MSDSDFLFSMRFAGPDHVGPILSGVAEKVFQHVGCDPAAVADLVRDLNGEILPVVDDGSRLEVQFRAHAGACEVIVCVDDREIWRTSRRTR